MYVVNALNIAEGYSISSKKDSGAGLEIKVAGKGGDVEFEVSSKADFNSQDTVIIAIKAVCFDISSKGILQNPLGTTSIQKN